ncbi:hypothetical protein PspLS_10165 [Pyricularia sp. CBS 133598]|nr:hypothetical protein PspLS_10165 [Pyricularia sp. CBS 133598]
MIGVDEAGQGMTMMISEIYWDMHGAKLGIYRGTMETYKNRRFDLASKMQFRNWTAVLALVASQANNVVASQGDSDWDSGSTSDRG